MQYPIKVITKLLNYANKETTKFQWILKLYTGIDQLKQLFGFEIINLTETSYFIRYIIQSSIELPSNYLMHIL